LLADRARRAFRHDRRRGGIFCGGEIEHPEGAAHRPPDRLRFRHPHQLDPEERKTKGPDKLGKFLSWVVEQRPELEVFVLKWDLGMINTLGRGSTPLRILDWTTSKRMHFKLDGAHPVVRRTTRRSW
jgi:hypothetical protein